jgi:AcrR family transcriptional regulator
MSGKRAESRERTKNALIAAAQELLATNDLEASIASICKTAEIAVGTFYNYFDSKRALLNAAAEAALLTYTPQLEAIMAANLDDPAIGFIRATRFSCRMPEYLPRTAKIIVAAGPQAFTDFNPYAQPAFKALQTSIDRGLAKCDDPVAFFVAFSGAYQNVLAFSLSSASFTSVNADQMIAGFMRQLGYSEEKVQEVCFTPFDLSKIAPGYKPSES